MNKFIIFISGLAIGATGGYFITKYVMREKTEAEIQSVKDAFKQIAEEEKKSLEDKKEQAKEAMTNYGGNAQNVSASTDNVNTNVSGNPAVDDSPEKDRKKDDTAAPWSSKKHLEPKEGEPYCITDDEVGETGNDIEYLTYYSDGVLAYDDSSEVIRHPDEVVGKDNLYHFGEFEEDMLYVRDPVESTDYSIQLSDQPYKKK